MIPADIGGIEDETFLHQRRDQPEDTAAELPPKRVSAAVIQRDFLRLLQRFLEIIFDGLNFFILVHIDSAFKVKIQTSEIQIDGADYRFAVIRCKNLCMDKPRCIFKNADSCFYKDRIIGSCQKIGI